MVGMQTAGSPSSAAACLAVSRDFPPPTPMMRSALRSCAFPLILAMLAGLHSPVNRVFSPFDSGFVERSCERFFRRRQRFLASADQGAMAPGSDAVAGLAENAGTIHILGGSRTNKAERRGLTFFSHLPSCLYFGRQGKPAVPKTFWAPINSVGLIRLLLQMIFRDPPPQGSVHNTPRSR